MALLISASLFKNKVEIACNSNALYQILVTLLRKDETICCAKQHVLLLGGKGKA
jgi:hypothetical protein